MAKVILVGPDAAHMPPNTADETPEKGWSFKRIVDAVNTMFTELYISLAQVGTTAVDFGAFPGTPDTSVDVTGQTAILDGSNVQAWLEATATAEHSIDEHRVDPPIITVGNIVAGVGFTIYAVARDGGRSYGTWTVQWKWQ